MIDFLSMEMTTTDEDVVSLSNKAKISTMVKEAGYEGIKPSKTAPILKSKLKQAYQMLDPLDNQEAEEMDQHKGRLIG